MTNPIQAKRMQPPSMPAAAVFRHEVDLALDKALEKNAVFIQAPAGFGKTAAVILWLSRRALMSAWIPLGVYDDFPAPFCRYLLTAISLFDDKNRGFVQGILDDPGFDAAPYAYLFQGISHISAEVRDAVIILDDLHLIEHEGNLKIIPQVIKKLPVNWKMILISRQAPPQAFADMVLKDQFGYIRQSELRFTKRQIMELYSNFGLTITAGQATAVERETGGWALGLGARLLAEQTGQNTKTGNAGEEYIFEYLKTEIWAQWDESTQEFLLQTSILEDLDTVLCDQFSKTDSKQLLLRLQNKSGLVIRLSEDTFRYHHIFRDFLRRMADERQLDRSRQYILAGDDMLAKGKFPMALDYYLKSGNNDALDEFLRRMADSNITNTGVEDYFISFQNSILKKLPPERLEENYLLVQDCIWTSFLGGDLEQMLFWQDKLDKLLAKGKIIEPQFLGVAVLLQYVNPYADPWRFTEPLGLEETPLQNSPSISLTMNLPFLHKAHRDYSDILNRSEEFLPKIRDNLQNVIGESARIMVDGIAAGLLYEQNKLKGAKEYALKTLAELTPQTAPELCFSANMHLAAILTAEGEHEQVQSIISHTEEMMNRRSALYLNANLQALIAKQKMSAGDLQAGRDWLASYMADPTDNVTLYQICQALTTARALIATGDFPSALRLTAKILIFAESFKRHLDRIEALILSSVALWKMRDRNFAVDQMGKAVSIAVNYAYIRPFADEGGEVIPILNKLLNRTVSGLGSVAEGAFIRELLLEAHQNAQMAPGLTSGLEPPPVKLSKRQEEILNLLARHLSIRDISLQTGLKLNTVKSHLYKLYEKLEVSTAADAILQGRRLGLIPEKE